MVLISEVEPAVSDPRDELADADVISSGGEDFGAFAASRWPTWSGVSGGGGGRPGGAGGRPLRRLGHRARRIRSRRARIVAVPVLAGVVAAVALLIPDSHPATRLAPPGQQAVVTNTTAGLGSGAFAGGTADGRQWQLAVQDIADPGFRCLPGVSVNGNDADPLFANPHPLRQIARR